MVQVAIEYMILTPVLILLIFLLPLTANAVVNSYANSRQTSELKDISSHLGSTIQQVYFSLNHETIPPSTVSFNTGIPPLLEGYKYTVNGTSRADPISGATIVNFQLRLDGSGVTTNSSITLGPNVVWINSFFFSNSASAYISATKSSNSTIQIRIPS